MRVAKAEEPLEVLVRVRVLGLGLEQCPHRGEGCHHRDVDRSYWQDLVRAWLGLGLGFGVGLGLGSVTGRIWSAPG